MHKKGFISELFCIIIVIAIIFGIAWLVDDSKKMERKGKSQFLLDVTDLHDYVSSIHRYNITQRDGNISVLLKYGGNCAAYTKYYESRLKELGIPFENQLLYWNSSSAHTFTLAYKDKEYCMLDQTDIHCVKVE